MSDIKKLVDEVFKRNAVNVSAELECHTMVLPEHFARGMADFLRRVTVSDSVLKAADYATDSIEAREDVRDMLNALADEIDAARGKE